VILLGFVVFLVIYILICLGLYFAQESLIFHPQKLPKDFDFTRNFPNSTEINLKSTDGINLNGLILHANLTSENSQNSKKAQNNLQNSDEKAQSENSQSWLNSAILQANSTTLKNNSTKLESRNLKMENSESLNQAENSQNSPNYQIKSEKSSKGLIFYLHGNSGSIAGWGNVAKFYNELGWDVLMPDYRGFGKSEGQITSQNQLFEDNQLFYNFAKSLYSQDKIVVMGFSIGTGMAAKIAEQNTPKMLILQAPYYSLNQVLIDNFLFIPDFLLKYKLETAKYVDNSKLSVNIFHGLQDETIFYSNSIKILKNLQNNDSTKLFELKNQTHMGIEENPEFRQKIKEILK